jgi:hypothetical protein
MNYDRNGVLVTTSRPRPVLKKSYRVVTIDSRDRDLTKYVKVNGGSSSSDPGDYVVYLPRPFEKVTRIRLMNAAVLGVQPSDTYVMMQIEGLNRMDECAAGADRSGYIDSAFAKLINDRPAVTGAAYTYANIVAVGNRTFYQSANPSLTGTLSVSAGNANGITVTYTMTTAPANPPPVNTFITVTGPVGAPAGFSGIFEVISSTTTSFTVFNSTLGSFTAGGSFAYSSAGLNPTIESLTSSGNALTIVFSNTHFITVGKSLTITTMTGATPTTLVGTVTSVPSLTSIVLTIVTPFTGTLPSSLQSGTVITVNNLQYAYSTLVTNSFIAGQYVVISGLPNSTANASAQILQTSLTSDKTGTFETTNVGTGPVTSNNTAGTAVISQSIYYNDMSYAPNITYYNPPIGTLDRMHITLRRHLPLSSITTTNPSTAPIIFGPAENTFTFEIEYLDNVFEDVSTFETRLDNSSYTPRQYV